MFKRKNNNPEISFVSMVDGLEKIEECVPKPYKKYLPEWWKDMPLFNDNVKTVKGCPSFADLFSLGYVMPMWFDSSIYYNKEINLWNTYTYGPSLKKTFTANAFHDDPNTDEYLNITVHSNKQMTDFQEPSFYGKSSSIIFKFNCPWRIITPPGYSVLQLPLLYHFDKKFSVLPGVIDTDIHHEINQQVLCHSDNDLIEIQRGEPFALYIPFERKKYNHIVRYKNSLDAEIFNLNSLRFLTKKPFSGEYKKMQKNRDKD